MKALKAIRRWPVRWSILLGLLLSAVAAMSLKDIVIDGGIYDLLTPDDPVAKEFNEFARVTPGLEELIVVCEPDSGLRNTTLESLADHPLIEEHTRTYLRPGMSSVYAFSLVTDPADWQESGPVIRDLRHSLAEIGADCGLTGTPAVVYETQSELNSDLSKALAIAVVLVIVLFAYVYRIGWLAILMLVPVFLGIGWGLAAYVVVRGEVTLLAATVPTLLVGIGIDHCIHLIQSTRFHLQHSDETRDEAIMSSWRQLFRPITVATLTTTAAFAALTTAELKGLADLGWAGVFVTLGVYVSCLLLVPAVLSVCRMDWLTRHSVLVSRLEWLAPAILRHKTAILVATGIAIVGSGMLATDLRFLDDNRKLQTSDLEALVLQDRIADEHELSASPLLLRFASEMDAIELQAEIDRPAEIVSLVAVADVPGLLQVHTAENPFVSRNYKPAVAALEQWIADLEFGDYSISGAPRLNARVDEVIHIDVANVPYVAIGLVLVVLVIGTRSLLRPAAVLLPLAAAMLWLVGLMASLDIAASLVTVAALPLIIGIGVDGGVHMLAAWKRYDADINRVYADTGLAILVTILTSLLAFTAFVFVRSPAMVQFGSQVATALLGILVGTLVVLPLLLLKFRKPNDA